MWMVRLQSLATAQWEQEAYYGVGRQEAVARQESKAPGMVQAWVAHFVTPLKCMYDKYDWRVTSHKPHKKHKQHDKQHSDIVAI